ncbi:hypothetical protein DFA_07015 [Cavenderia fasciculata]|uniref:Superoxide dismutase copper/zinc binding domain-containing protein n=1 Tax=Cavenderia fasciculata TaxID=261658 RepID=F4PXA7_CACFS|nr:uncharacterized protein DFA_07015 [Cavenderia fasciculata]EGG19910.1 hypothetical protein DFA_07015 [Cavenderia fasciculata]|eukprot:XP_004366893.1 hypothetical protein DFA_07015 [Cavenderia fasciculata]
MKIINSILLLIALLGFVSAQTTIQLASCALKPLAGSTVSGYVRIISTETEGTFIVVVNATGLTGKHGISVQQFADISSATSTGGIFSTGTGKSYGCPPTASIFDGALGNIDATDASGNYSTTIAGGQFVLTGNNSLIGHSFAIHNAEDTCTEGSSGAIVSQCVLGIGNPSTAGYNASLVTNVANSLLTGLTGVCQLSAIGTNNVSGSVFFQQQTDGSIRITSKIEGLNATIAHGLHIHTYGDINPTVASQTGGHWKLTTQTHNLPNDASRELGDLGNICAYDASGNAYYNWTTNYFGNFGEINSTSTAAPSSFVGHSVVVHALRDNGTANSFGDRIGQCVIGYVPNTKQPTDYFATPANINFETTPQCASITFPVDSAASSIILPTFAIIFILLKISNRDQIPDPINGKLNNVFA